MSCVSSGYLSPSAFPYVYPVNVIVGATPASLTATTFTWDFDTQGENFALNTSFGLTPKNFYTVYYEFTLTSTSPVSGTAATIIIFLKDVLGLISNVPIVNLPVNEYTNAGNTGVFQAVYSGYLSMDADFVPPANETNGFQFAVNLVPGVPPGGSSALAAEGLNMVISRLTIQQEPVSSLEPIVFSPSTLSVAYTFP
jgi:hypothetical protein